MVGTEPWRAPTTTAAPTPPRFRAKPTGGELRTSDESKEVLWVAPAELDGLNIHPTIRLRIRHGLEHRAEPYYS